MNRNDLIIINSLTSLAQAISMLDEEWHEHRYLEITVKRKAKQRTPTQNAALHLFLTQLSKVLNDAGYDMKRTLKHDVDIPWTPGAAKEYLWRPIQKALTQKDSTTQITTVEPTIIYETLCRYLGDKLGITCPAWPKKKEN